MAKKKIEDLKKQAKDLEEILMTVESDGIDAVSGEEVLPRLKSIAPLDYDAVKESSDSKAGEIVESVILLYLPANFVKDEEYVFQKMEVDKLTISNLLFQMKTAEHAIKKLLEEIDSGGTQPRAFEVLASLQRSKMEIVKHLASFMVTMENNYKNLKFDWNNIVEQKGKLIEAEAEATEVEEENTTKFRGTKGLMSIVQGYIEESKQGENDSSDK